MIYPQNYEQKTGFDQVREMLKSRCLSPLGQSRVDAMGFSTDTDALNTMMRQTAEMRRIKAADDSFPLDNFADMRPTLKRIRLEGTHMETDELFALRRSLDTAARLTEYLRRADTGADGADAYHYPALAALTEGVQSFPTITARIDQLLDNHGNVRDTASPELSRIRTELSRAEGSASRTLYSILRSAQDGGLVERDVAPALRDGRLVIPVAPGLKRKIPGIVHDESASGRTVYIEPAQVVEANNRIRELENDEKREILRLLAEVTKAVRPHWRELLGTYEFLADIDFVQAKAAFAEAFRAFEPELKPEPYADWIGARHPLLERHLQGNIVPLDLKLTPRQRILIISGPNAGGKSVCLKTVGLLQYMAQCGLPVPMSERSTVGTFADIMIDIGDEQSLENDLSTYSSHLRNMKEMMRHATRRTLILIDEFGTGTEPQIGGAIAESVLKQFWKGKSWAVITTHYQNLKLFSESHAGVANGAMLYDRNLMQPLFKLAIGQPGSSFAIDIARKTGIPEEVIRDAAAIVGSDYIESDRYLQDIVRDKRYWESKRTAIHQQEKELRKARERYERELETVEQSRREILAEARRKADELLAEANRKIENTIREIRETQAEKEDTRRLRAELAGFAEAVDRGEMPANSNGRQVKKKSFGTMTDSDFARRVEQIERRRQRHERRKADKAARQTAAAPKAEAIAAGSQVRIKGTTTVGTVQAVAGTTATVLFGTMPATVDTARLERAPSSAAATPEKQPGSLNNLQTFQPSSRVTRTTIDEHSRQFRPEIDVRGMRADDALQAVQRYIDDAIMTGAPTVRILHGKGNGILRALIQQYLRTVPNVVSAHDEDVRFGGAGITVVEL